MAYKYLTWRNKVGHQPQQRWQVLHACEPEPMTANEVKSGVFALGEFTAVYVKSEKTLATRLREWCLRTDSAPAGTTV